MIPVADGFWILAIALGLDALLGASRLWRPVQLRALPVIAHRLRERPAAAIVATFVLAAIAAAIGAAIEWLLTRIPYGGWGISLIASLLLGGNELLRRLVAISRATQGDDLERGRGAVAGFVRRDTDRLDLPGVRRAAIEVAARRFADVVVSPALWFALLGLPGLFAFAMLQASSAHFGEAAGRVRGVVDIPGTRLAAAFIAIAAPVVRGRPGMALMTVAGDAYTQRSQNSGWPVAAMAGALGLALSGPRWYGGTLIADPWVNADASREPGPGEISRALRVLIGGWAALLIVIVAAALNA